jgi:hypothetical protein
VNQLVENEHEMLWRVAVDVIPTRKRLAYILNGEHLEFPLCGVEEESSVHLIQRCIFAMAIWFSSR